MDPVIKSGDLVKAPPKGGGTLKRWRKRHFKLRATSLEYYADGSGIDIKGLIRFSTVTKLEQDVNHSRDHVFALHTIDRTYLFEAESALAKHEWTQAILQCLETCRPEDFQTGNYMNQANVASFLEAESTKPEPGSDPDAAPSPSPTPPAQGAPAATQPGVVPEESEVPADHSDDIGDIGDGGLATGHGREGSGGGGPADDAAAAENAGLDIDDDRRPEFQACAMQHYVAGSPKQLAMAPGEVFDILDSAAPWWIALNAAGEEGLVPSNYLEPIGYIYTEPVVPSAVSDPAPSLGGVAMAAN